jgi:hypothetical protein
MKINWRWPAGPDRPYAPLYLIVWRLVWFPPFLVGKLLSSAAVLASTLSWSEARDFFNAGY